MISAVAEMYEIHPQTLRLYEREGLLKPSRTEGNTRLYTDEALERLEFILNLARDLGVNIAGIAIVLIVGLSAAWVLNGFAVKQQREEEDSEESHSSPSRGGAPAHPPPHRPAPGQKR